MNDYKDFGIDMDELDRLLAEYGGGTEKKDTQPVEPKPEPVIPEYEKSEPEPEQELRFKYESQPEQEPEFKYEPDPESEVESELEPGSYESETESEPYVSEDEEAESELESESFESEYEEPAYKYEPDYDDEDDDYDEPTPSKSKIQLRGTASKIEALSEGTGSIYAAPKTTKIDRTKLLQARLAQSEKEKKEAEASSKVGEDQSKAGTVGSKSGSEGRIRRASKSEKSIGKKPKSEKHISRKPKSLVNVKEREEKAEPEAPETAPEDALVPLTYGIYICNIDLPEQGSEQTGVTPVAAASENPEAVNLAAGGTPVGITLNAVTPETAADVEEQPAEVPQQGQEPDDI